MQNKRFGAFSSSADPAKLAGTVQAFILAIGVIIVWGAKTLLGIELQAQDISDLAVSMGAMVAAIYGAYGVTRKFVVFVIDRYNMLRS